MVQTGWLDLADLLQRPVDLNWLYTFPGSSTRLALYSTASLAISLAEKITLLAGQLNSGDYGMAIDALLERDEAGRLGGSPGYE